MSTLAMFWANSLDPKTTNLLPYLQYKEWFLTGRHLMNFKTQKEHLLFLPTDWTSARKEASGNHVNNLATKSVAITGLYGTRRTGILSLGDVMQVFP